MPFDDYRCDRCGFSLPTGEGGTMYVIDENGQRIDCPILGGDGKAITVISKSIPDFLKQLKQTRSRYYQQRFQFRTWIASVRGQKPPVDPRTIYDERTGFHWDSVCRQCLAQCEFDPDRDSRICPSCGGLDVRTLKELLNNSCPECVLGTIRRVKTGIYV